MSNIPSMECEVEYSDEFGAWWATLSEKEQTAVAVTVGLLERMGPGLPFPLRTLYAFDPRRVAILLIGGDKTGDDRWYEVFVPIADRLYTEHLKEIRLNSPKKEGGSQ